MFTKIVDKVLYRRMDKYILSKSYIQSIWLQAQARYRNVCYDITLNMVPACL